MTTDRTSLIKLPKGSVRVSVGSDVFVRDNTACVAAASAIAAAYAGDISLVPCGVVFLYGDDGVVDGLTLDGELTWQAVIDSGVEKTDVLAFSYRATVDGTKVTFHARTQGIASGKSIKAACLVGHSKDGLGYEVLAVVDLGGKKKPADFEMSIDWTVKFKDSQDDSGEYVS